MKDKEKGLFTGFGSVFSFTAEQNMKGKGFKLSSIAIGLLVLAVCAAVSIIMAAAQKPEESGEDNYGIEENINESGEAEKRMDAIVVLNNAGMKESILKDFLTLCGFEDVVVEYSDLKVEEEYKDFSQYCTGNYKKPVGLRIDMDDSEITFSYYLFSGTGVSKDFVDGFAQSFEMYYNDIKYLETGLTESEIQVLNIPAWANTGSADGDSREMGVVIAQMIVPAVFSLLLFMMTCIYGQSITKVVMSEKSSKLMEVLLTSVKPYALIAGKIVAMSVIAVVQLLIWIVMGIVGFAAGDKIAQSVYPEYQNYVLQIIDLIRDSGTGFSAEAVVLAVLMTILGFFMYCVWAGFIASVVDRVDDVSTAMSLFQIPVMLGFMLSYIGSLLEMDGLIKAAEYIPVVSPFVMPADVLLGKASFAGGLVSFVILAAFSFVLVLLTGKVYKSKVFHRK